MAHFTVENRSATFTIRHRIVCENDSYKGPWRENENLCYEDAKAHRKKPGNKNHVMRIVTEQTLIRNLILEEE